MTRQTEVDVDKIKAEMLEQLRDIRLLRAAIDALVERLDALEGEDVATTVNDKYDVTTTAARNGKIRKANR